MADASIPKRPYGTGSIVRHREKFKGRIRVEDENGERRVISRVFNSVGEASLWLDKKAREQRNKGRVSIKPPKRAQLRVVEPTGVKDWNPYQLISREILRWYADEVKNGKRNPRIVADTRQHLVRLAPYLDWVEKVGPDFKNSRGEDQGDMMRIVLSTINRHLKKGLHLLGNLKTHREKLPHLTLNELTDNEAPFLHQGERLSESRRKAIRSTVMNVVERMIDSNYIQNRRATYEKDLPKITVERPPVEKVALPTESAKIITDYLFAHPCSVENHARGFCSFRYLLMAQSGRRQSEMIGLYVSDFEEDGDNLTYTVRRHYVARPFKHGCGKDDDGNFNCGWTRAWVCSNPQGGPLLKFGHKGGLDTISDIPVLGAVKDAYYQHLAVWEQDWKNIKAAEKAEAKGNRDTPDFVPRWKKYRQNALHDEDGRAIPDKKLLFITPRGKYIHPTNDWDMWREVQQRAYEWHAEQEGNGTEDEQPERRIYGLHSVRHRAASDFNSDGVNPAVLQAILGHRSFATTTRYVGVSKREKQALPDLLKRPEGE